uniref:Uncharacterized protein n=1 Tax=Strongyloides stercoralis TaxID=6248 RepID=A0AAF5D9W3_STRER
MKKCYALISIKEIVFVKFILPKLNKHVKEDITKEVYYNKNKDVTFLKKTNQYMNRKFIAEVLRFNCQHLSKIYLLKSNEALENYKNPYEVNCVNGRLLKVYSYSLIRKYRNKFTYRSVKNDAE